MSKDQLANNLCARFEWQPSQFTDSIHSTRLLSLKLNSNVEENNIKQTTKTEKKTVNIAKTINNENDTDQKLFACSTRFEHFKTLLDI